MNKMNKWMWHIILPILFLIYSVPLFLRIYATTQMIVDEKFHLQQGLHFCNRQFFVWDSKITTFPGLYLVSLVLNPFDMCNVLGLRLISLLAAAINIVLLYVVRKDRLAILGIHTTIYAVLDALTIATLPPLYFLSHVYYTDTLSLTMVLLFYYYWQHSEHLTAAVCGSACVLMRQTNIVWLGMACGVTALDTIVENFATVNNRKPQSVNLLTIKLWWNLFTNGKLLMRCIWKILKNCCYYLFIILPFLGFIFLNGSIVVGDKRAHEATLHIPQLFYFTLFTLMFAINNTLEHLFKAVQILWHHKFFSLCAFGLIIIIVKFNTLIHPYLLADNRHYTFYVWQRFYGRYTWFKYAMCPIYLIGLMIIQESLRLSMRTSWLLMFYITLFLYLCFQRLLEIRYFLVPFVLLRLHMKPQLNMRLPIWLDLSIYIVINACTFYIFFTKEIKWKDYNEMQRIIW